MIKCLKPKFKIRELSHSFKIENLKLKILSRGITLVEVIVVVFIIAVFSTILISDFPKIRRRIALSRAVYKFSQDMRKVQDMALSGVQISGAKGYGIYVELEYNKRYILYADKDDSKYTEGEAFETIDLSQETSGVIIKEINNICVGCNSVSINFNPPSPTTTITSLSADNNKVEIVFALEGDTSSNGKVSINTSGLIEAK